MNSRFLERTYQGFAGEDLIGNRFVMPSTGEGGGTEGAMYHHGFGRHFIPMGIVQYDVSTGAVFSVLEPGQVVNVEASNAGPAGSPIAPYTVANPGSGIRVEDGRATLIPQGNVGETQFWAGFALEASTGPGDVVRMMFVLVGDFNLVAEVPPVQPISG